VVCGGGGGGGQGEAHTMAMAVGVGRGRMVTGKNGSVSLVRKGKMGPCQAVTATTNAPVLSTSACPKGLPPSRYTAFFLG